jgi:methyl-accepting chemotaxis protein
MRKVLVDISDLQERFSAATGKIDLLGMIDSVQAGHQDIVAGLSEALGHIQFHDVMRQRTEQVLSSLQQLNEHLQEMADQMGEKPWHPDDMVGLRCKLEDQVSGYVMQSQRIAHLASVGQPVDSDGGSDRPKIELF